MLEKLPSRRLSKDRPLTGTHVDYRGIIWGRPGDIGGREALKVGSLRKWAQNCLEALHQIMDQFWVLSSSFGFRVWDWRGRVRIYRA